MATEETIPYFDLYEEWVAYNEDDGYTEMPEK